MATYTAIFFQAKSNIEEIRFSEKSLDTLTQRDLKVWVIGIFLECLKLFQDYRVHHFDLRSKIFIDVYGQKTSLKLQIQRVNKIVAATLDKTSLPFKFDKKQKFILSYRNADEDYKMKKSIGKNKLSYNITPILNSVEYQNYQKTKVFNPIIYTGMTQ